MRNEKSMRRDASRKEPREAKGKSLSSGVKIHEAVGAEQKESGCCV
jgi:hypothetical protein